MDNLILTSLVIAIIFISLILVQIRHFLKVQSDIESEITKIKRNASANYGTHKKNFDDCILSIEELTKVQGSYHEKRIELDDKYELIARMFLTLEFERLNKPKYEVGDKKALKGYIVTEVRVVGDVMKMFCATIAETGLGIKCEDLPIRMWLNSLRYEYSATHLTTGETTKFTE